MRFLLLFVLLTFVALPGFAQLDSTYLPIVANWSVGDTYEYRITRIHETWDESEQLNRDSFSYIANFEVIDSTADFYTIKWARDFGDSQVLDMEGLPDSFRIAWRQVVNILPHVTYKTSWSGEFLGIENWEAYAETVRNFFSQAVILAQGAGSDQADLPDGFYDLLDSLASKTLIESRFFPELPYFHMLMGLEYSTQQPWRYETYYPSLLGQDSLLAQGVIYFDTIDYYNYLCRMTQEVRFEQPELQRHLKTTVGEFDLTNDTLNAVIEKSDLLIIDSNEFLFDFYYGIPVYIDARRENFVSMDSINGKVVEQLRLELLK